MSRFKLFSSFKKFQMVQQNKMSEEYHIAEEFLIEDLDTLKVLADSRRLSILKAIGSKPITVKQIAKRVGIPPTKLYYHMNMMEKHNIIQVAETRVVSGIIEKLYTITAKTYRPGPDLLTTGDTQANSQNLESMVFSVMDNVRDELLRSFRAGLIQLSKEVPAHGRLDIASMVLSFTDEEVEEFDKRLYELVKELADGQREERPNRKTHNFFFVRFKKDEEDEEE